MSGEAEATASNTLVSVFVRKLVMAIETYTRPSARVMLRSTLSVIHIKLLGLHLLDVVPISDRGLR